LLLPSVLLLFETSIALPITGLSLLLTLLHISLAASTMRLDFEMTGLYGVKRLAKTTRKRAADS